MPKPNQPQRISLKARPIKVTLLILLVMLGITSMPSLLNVVLPEIPYSIYLPLHTILEVIAVVLAGMTFAVIREQALVKMTLRSAVVACAFFAIFWLDLAHLLSYKGMPPYFNENTAEKAINFWLVARLLGATTLCFVVLPLADKRTGLKQYYAMLTAAITLVLACHYWFILHPEAIPRTYIEGMGLTQFKIVTEYSVIFISAVTIYLIILYRHFQRAFHAPALLAAVVTTILSELCFTLYNQLSDIYNIIGHLLKLVSYLFLYRALVYETLAAPYLQLVRSKAELAATLSATPDILLDVDQNGVLHRVHSRPDSNMSIASTHFIGSNTKDVLPQNIAETMLKAMNQAAQRKGCSDAYQCALNDANAAAPIWFQIIAAIKPNTASLQRFILSVRDITAQKNLHASEQLNALAFHTREAIMITDAEQRIIRVNPAFTDITGYSEAEIVGQNPSRLSSGLHDKLFYQRLWGALKEYDVWSGEIYNRRKNGEVFPEHVIINALKDNEGQVTHYIASFNDISKAKADQQRIHRLAFYDPLTHLPNRRLLLDKIVDTQSESQRNGQFAALFFIDLDHFKRLNDSLGHSFGDELLRQLADRLQLTIRTTDILARPGGDEFILLAKLQTTDQTAAALDAQILGNKVLEQIRQPYMLKNHQYNITASIGIALFNDSSNGVDELMSSADLAMYHSKESGRNQLFFFEPQMQQKLKQRQKMEQGLKQALANEQFHVYYQPKVNTLGHVVGYEALIRWQHPEFGLISPDSFIPLAESTGLIIDIGSWVLEQACEQIAKFSAQGESLSIAVNVSQRQLTRTDFAELVSTIVVNSGIDPSLLELEITESMLNDDLENTRQKLTALSQLGITFSLDDFGTGYSSLYYLQKLPMNVLKIDQSFVREFLTQETDYAIVKTIVAMAKALSLKVVAEGVEEQEQYEALVALECDFFQGYLFGKPSPLS
ncbi:EAL domain-containing protein [Rheinheimera baltica]|uniref:EAL domain-containing protein n=1 Tax=Rheinheimera baltica TaxID=67576 RepID=A0ABT9I3B6_9GAMM|nr:EAL domain-containing protein [Rheinheimera baltica]MDP5137673.1 EAL domain-containing protein [Rheinheimera baltica]